MLRKTHRGTQKRTNNWGKVQKLLYFHTAGSERARWLEYTERGAQRSTGLEGTAGGRRCWVGSEERRFVRWAASGRRCRGGCDSSAESWSDEVQTKVRRLWTPELRPSQNGRARVWITYQLAAGSVQIQVMKPALIIHLLQVRVCELSPETADSAQPPAHLWKQTENTQAQPQPPATANINRDRKPLWLFSSLGNYIFFFFFFTFLLISFYFFKAQRSGAISKTSAPASLYCKFCSWQQYFIGSSGLG